MPFEVVQPGEPGPSIFAAQDLALEWLVACVLSLMSLEVFLACKGLVAAFTAE